MAFTPLAGKNGLIYVSGTANEITGANAWSITIEHDAITYSKFGDEWESQFSGIKRWSGSIGGLKDTAGKLLTNAAVADAAVALLIYPDNTSMASFFSGSAVFSAGAEGGMDGAIMATADFVGTGTLGITGFA